MTTVFKLVLMYIDHDELGIEGVTHMLENARFPNHAPTPTVVGFAVKHIEWDDGDPLNMRDKNICIPAFHELFKPAPGSGKGDEP